MNLGFVKRIEKDEILFFSAFTVVSLDRDVDCVAGLPLVEGGRHSQRFGRIELLVPQFCWKRLRRCVFSTIGY